MNKIKIIGAFIFILSVSLAVLSNLISQNNQINSELISTINEQKAFTQEISKNIFYIYKNKNASTSQLNNSIKSFISNMQTREKKLNNISSKNIQEQTDKIILLWNEFYSNVQDFRDLNKITTAYSNVILEKIVIIGQPPGIFRSGINYSYLVSILQRGNLMWYAFSRWDMETRNNKKKFPNEIRTLCGEGLPIIN